MIKLSKIIEKQNKKADDVKIQWDPKLIQKLAINETAERAVYTDCHCTVRHSPRSRAYLSSKFRKNKISQFVI